MAELFSLRPAFILCPSIRSPPVAAATTATQTSYFFLGRTTRARESVPLPIVHVLTSPLSRPLLLRRGGWGRKAGEHEVSSYHLEEQIYDFMMNSSSPGNFPSKKDLEDAGRWDLVQAIAEEGGWLTLGWDSGEDIGNTHTDDDLSIGGSAVSDWVAETRASSSSGSSPSGRLIDTESDGENDAGIHGILRRLEKERSFSFVRDKDIDENHYFGDHRSDLMIHYSVSTGWKDSRGVLMESTEDLLYDSGDTYSQIKTIPEREDNKIASPSACKVDCSSFPLTDLEDGVEEEVSYSDSENKSQRPVHLRLKELESKLNFTLNLLRSTSTLLPLEYQDRTPAELHKLSDDWEFQETEIIKAKDKLRSIRAKLAVFEGKMALDIVEARKTLEKKQNRIDDVQKALWILRSACIVWPNNASEVLLSGSFDGWASRRKMERSNTGIFSLQLRLYPGRYEIKFIVDGVWRIDPLRPIVNINGHENNLLVVI